ncbi:MAG: DUF2628 domain-containing protein [Candidatus Omnitrophica bacterium]|nr:DUF2628 domain-containing protein [Candidatus Omnitrophota bacterium]
MQVVTFHIHLTNENKRNPEVIDILVRESGNSKEQMIEFLKTHDTISVPDMRFDYAQKLVEEFARVGVVANYGGVQEVQLVKPGGDGWFCKPSWSWGAFFFTYLWYAFKGLWVKLSVYIMINWALHTLLIPDLLQPFTQLGFWLYLAMYAKHDLYLKRECDERLWLRFPFRKFKKLYIICLIAFIVGAVALPVTKSVKSAHYGFSSIMNFEETTQKAVQFNGYTFRTVPGTWWKFVDPPPGMNINAEQRSGNFTQTLKYESNKHTVMMATMCSTKPMSGMDNTTLGVAAVELLPGKGGGAVDDQATIDAAVKQFAANIPFFLGFLKKFFTVEYSEAAYKEIAGYKWGRVSLRRQITIAGKVGESIADVYWTTLQGDLLVVYTDAFPEYVGSVRDEAERMIDSLAAYDPNAVTMLDVSVKPASTISSYAGGQMIPGAATVDQSHTIAQFTTVRAAVRAGENYLRAGDRASAQKCLDKAITLVHSEADYEEMEEFARTMAQ